jgi:hypothetical protein
MVSSPRQPSHPKAARFQQPIMPVEPIDQSGKCQFPAEIYPILCQPHISMPIEYIEDPHYIRLV